MSRYAKSQFDPTNKNLEIGSSLKNGSNLSSPTNIQQSIRNENGVDVQTMNVEDDNDLSKKLPVKSHVLKLEEMISDLQNDNEHDKQDIQLLRTDLVTIDNIYQDICEETYKTTMDEIVRIEKFLTQKCNIESAQVQFFEQQLEQLNAEKVKLQEHNLILDQRISHTESNIGFKQN